MGEFCDVCGFAAADLRRAGKYLHLAIDDPLQSDVRTACALCIDSDLERIDRLRDPDPLQIARSMMYAANEILARISRSGGEA